MNHIDSKATLSEFIGAIYDCALEPDKWNATLDRLRRVLDFIAAELGVITVPSGEPLLSITSSPLPSWLDWRPRNRRDMMDLWGGPETMKAMPLGQVLLLSDMRERGLWEESMIYRTVGKLMGVHDIVVIGLSRDSTTLGALSFVRQVSAGNVTSRERKTLSLLVPHFQRSLTISRLLDLENVLVKTFDMALEAVRCGVILTDQRGQILLANSAAEQMLRSGTFAYASHGRLKVRLESAADELARAIRLAEREESQLGDTGVAIRLSDEDETPVFAHVLPLNGSDFRARLAPNAVAAVFFRMDPDEEQLAQKVAETFKLTPAERRVLTGVLRGKTLSETAVQLNVGSSTVKTHLEGVFAKTGVNRQIELVRLASRIAPPVGPL